MKFAVKLLLLLVIALFAVGPTAACGGTYVAVKDGKCNWGRKWVPPKKEGDKWVAGYCTDS